MPNDLEQYRNDFRNTKLHLQINFSLWSTLSLLKLPIKELFGTTAETATTKATSREFDWLKEQKHDCAARAARTLELFISVFFGTTT